MAITWCCPKSHEPLIAVPQSAGKNDDRVECYISPGSRLRYPVIDGVPVLLVEEAQELTSAEVERLLQLAG